jgi:putative phosphoesterase
MVTDVLVVADTHVGAGGVGRLLARIDGELAVADVILHAGDLTDAAVLDALSRCVAGGCVHAVKGNNDRGLSLPERLAIDIDGCSVAMVHDSGAATGRRARLRRWFPHADVVVFGHSHLPWYEVDVRDGHAQHHLNPGSAMQRRRAPTCTVAHLLIDGGAVASIRHVAVGETRPDQATISARTSSGVRAPTIG